MSYEEMKSVYEQLDADGKKQIDILFKRLKTKKQDVPDEAIPLFGIWKGKIQMAPDFDEPLEDFKEYT